MRALVEKVAVPGSKPSSGPDLPYTSRSKKALELAMSEARSLKHSYVGTEHLLLGLLAERTGIGGQVLVECGVSLDPARQAVTRILSGPDAPRRPANPVVDLGFAVRAAQPGAFAAPVLLSLSAAIAWIIGLALIFFPREFEASMALVVDDSTATIAQAQGALLLGLGAINWVARLSRDGLALRAILYGNLVVQSVSFAIVARAVVRDLVPPSAAAALVLHLALGLAFGWRLYRLARPN